MKTEKIFWGVVIAFFVVTFFTCKSCGKVDVISSSETTDTNLIKVKDSTGGYTPNVSVIEVGQIPGAVRIIKVPGKDRRFLDSFIVYEPRIIDTAAILADYYARVHYQDTVTTKYGSIRINDIISKNRIDRRQVFTDFSIPEITKTVTINPKKKNEIYAGMIIQGNELQPFRGVGPSLMLKTRQDRIFEGAALYDRTGRIQYQAGIKFKISFRKKN